MTARDEGAGTMEVNLGRFVLQEHELTGLHPRTAKLVRTFAFALAGKLRKAEQKYGYSDGWSRGDWEAECRTHLHEHVAKGDPLDVAAYSAFCWFHKWSTAPVSAPGMDREAVARIIDPEAMVTLDDLIADYRQHSERERLGWDEERIQSVAQYAYDQGKEKYGFLAQRALAKADQIIALQKGSEPADGSQVEPSTTGAGRQIIPTDDQGGEGT